MGNSPRLGFGRKNTGTKNYDKQYFIATEGNKTEPRYFEYLKSKLIKPTKIQILIVKGGASESSPDRVLEHAKTEILKAKKENRFFAQDEVWIVCDKDDWSSDKLDLITRWCREKSKKEQRHFALSNPCFELWYLLHFERGDGLLDTPHDCLNRLKKYHPEYSKSECPKFTLAQTKAAIDRAKIKDNNTCLSEDAWPKTPGHTTVWRLVEQFLSHLQSDF